MKQIYLNGWAVSANKKVLTHQETGDRFDISHWTYEDIEEFMSDDHNRYAHAEMLERL